MFLGGISLGKLFLEKAKPNEILRTHPPYTVEHNPCPDKMNPATYTSDPYQCHGPPDILRKDQGENFLFSPCKLHNPKDAVSFQRTDLYRSLCNIHT
jgi:hypothetical protein